MVTPFDIRQILSSKAILKVHCYSKSLSFSQQTPEPIHMNSNNSSINRTNNNQQLAPGAPTSHQQLFNHNNNSNFSQYGINNYSNQNNLNNNFTNMVAAGQQGGMDVGYNSQVYKTISLVCVHQNNLIMNN